MTGSLRGEYWRLLLPGKYTVRFSAGRGRPTFTWESLGESLTAPAAAPMEGLSMHAVAARLSGGAAGGWRLFLCGGVPLADKPPMTRWLPPAAAGGGAAPAPSQLPSVPR